MTTSNSLVDELLSQLQGAPMQQIASQLGTNGAQAGSAIEAALPMLMGALGHNASQPQGAEALFGALQRDHADSGNGGLDLGGLLGSVLGGVMGGGLGGASAGASGSQLDAGGILGHIFGGNQPQAEQGLGQATGLSGGQAGQLLKILAPIVMAFLAKRVSAGGLDSGDLGNMLGQEKARVQEQGGLGGGLLGSLLDQNGDGKLDMGDLFKIGGSLLTRR